MGSIVLFHSCPNRIYSEADVKTLKSVVGGILCTIHPIYLYCTSMRIYLNCVHFRRRCLAVHTNPWNLSSDLLPSQTQTYLFFFSYFSPGEKGCQPFWDAVVCWPHAVVGETVQRACPAIFSLFKNNTGDYRGERGGEVSGVQAEIMTRTACTPVGQNKLNALKGAFMEHSDSSVWNSWENKTISEKTGHLCVSLIISLAFTWTYPGQTIHEIKTIVYMQRMNSPLA